MRMEEEGDNDDEKIVLWFRLDVNKLYLLNAYNKSEFLLNNTTLQAHLIAIFAW